MTIWRAIRDAALGWIAILRGRADWRGYFALTWPGLVSALAVFILAAFIANVVAALSLGVPTLGELAVAMLVQSLCIVSILAATAFTRLAVPATLDLREILVPGTYAMVFYLLAGAVLVQLGAMLLPLLWVAVAGMLYRLGRVGPGWSHGVSAAFAVLTLVLLVGLPMTLYMLVAKFSASAP